MSEANWADRLEQPRAEIAYIRGQFEAGEIAGPGPRCPACGADILLPPEVRRGLGDLDG